MARKRIAVTGGIGSGKSTVLNWLREQGYPVFSCDQIYHEIMGSHSYVQKIEKSFPDCVTEGRIDRKKLAETIFSNSEKRKTLNDIAHPMIMERLNEKMQQSEGAYVFAEVPLLFEGSLEKSFDKIIVVLRERDARIASVMQRDGNDKKHVENQIAAQFDYDSEAGKKRLQAYEAICIANNGSEAELEKRLEKVIDRL